MKDAPAFVVPVAPDAAQAIAFFKVLFPARNGESVHMRAVPEPKDGRHPRNCHYALDENFDDNVRGFLDWCAVDGRAAFFLPGIVKGAGTGKADVLNLPAVLVDLDKGQTNENLKATEALLGPASIVVESGGATDAGPKLHAYWCLASGGDNVGQVCAAREELAKRYGGDPAFKQAAQVIRLPGSVHFKGAPKLVKLRSVVGGTGYDMARIASQLKIGNAKPASSNVVDFLDYSKVEVRHSDVERVLSAPIHEGAADDLTRFEGVGKALGHFIRGMREGRYTEAEAWTAACEWNAAVLVPPWSEERLMGDWARLLRIDIQARGPIVPVQAVMEPKHAEGWSVVDWRADRFAGASPERRWLVEGLIPLATPGLFAAVGDAGKSMLALQLALHITTSPPINLAAAMDLSSPRFFGQPVLARGAAVILTAEDDADELHRRLNGLDPTFARSKAPLFVVPMLSTGGARSILIDGPSGPMPTEFWRELRAQLLAIPNLRLVVLDPLSSFVGADINKDNLAGAALMTMLGELAATSGAAIMLVHHFAKATMPTNLSDARGSIRGAGALVDNGRWSLVLWEAEPDDAAKVLKTLGQALRSKQAGVVYFGGLAKGNAPGEKKTRTLVRSPSGVLEDVTDRLDAAAPRKDELDDAVFAAIVARRHRYPRWTFAIGRTAIAKEIYPLVQDRDGVTIPSVKTSVDRLIANGLLREGESPGKFEPFEG